MFWCLCSKSLLLFKDVKRQILRQTGAQFTSKPGAGRGPRISFKALWPHHELLSSLEVLAPHVLPQSSSASTWDWGLKDERWTTWNKVRGTVARIWFPLWQKKTEYFEFTRTLIGWIFCNMHHGHGAYFLGSDEKSEVSFWFEGIFRNNSLIA